MHLHLHLKECMLDYGPVYSFWCFSFERFNGILGKFNNNHIGQLKSRLWDNFSRANNFICHGHVNMVLNLPTFCDDTDMHYVKHSVLVSAERLEKVAVVLPLCTVVEL